MEMQLSFENYEVTTYIRITAFKAIVNNKGEYNINVAFFPYVYDKYIFVKPI